MARTAYHVTSETADSGYIKVEPSTWYNVGAVEMVYLDHISKGILSVNTVEDDGPSAIGLKYPSDAALETTGRTLYVYGAEGQKFITDDGA